MRKIPRRRNKRPPRWGNIVADELVAHHPQCCKNQVKQGDSQLIVILREPPTAPIPTESQLRSFRIS